ncbi:MAG: methyltransferase [Candidatus Nanohaloarchaea archaeon]
MENPGEELRLRSETPRGNYTYSFRTADGVSKDFRDAEIALADHVDPGPGDRVLVVQSGFGFLPVALGKDREGETVGAETSDRAFQLTEMNIEENGVEHARARKLPFYSELGKDFDVILYAPRGYEPVDVVKDRLSVLAGKLVRDGELFVAGRKTDGAKRYGDHLDSFGGESGKMVQEGRQRIYRYVRTAEPEGERFDVETGFSAAVRGAELEFGARKGLFSPGELDDGSRLLIENLDFSGDDRVLDLACGYGAVAAFVRELFGSEVFLSDDDRTATHYAERNMEMNGFDRFEVECADCLDGFRDRRFDAVVTNPPTHAGKQVTSEMFHGAHSVLRDGGELYVVYNANMRYGERLGEFFSSVEVLAEDDGFRVAKAVK